MSQGTAAAADAVIEARVYPLLLTDEQERACERAAIACRNLWNVALRHREEVYKTHQHTVRYTTSRAALNAAGGDLSKVPHWQIGQQKWLSEARQNPDAFAWLDDAPSAAEQMVLRNLDMAYQRMFKGLGRRPRPKDRRSPLSLQVPATTIGKGTPRRLSKRRGVIRFPLLGDLQFRWTRDINGEIGTVTIAKRDGRWWVSMLVYSDRTVAEPNDGPAIGIDRGVAIAAVGSDGSTFTVPRLTVEETARLRRLERRAARQEEARRARPAGERARSARHQQTLDQIAKLKRRERDRRRDATHKISRDLVTRHGFIAIEDLNVAAMTKSARGTVENPGTNVAQKAGLNRAILQSGWGALRTQIEYKAPWYGSQVVVVDPAYTSQCCSSCGHTDPRNRTTQADFRCVACGHEENADVNAARNILARATAEGGTMTPVDA